MSNELSVCLYLKSSSYQRTNRALFVSLFTSHKSFVEAATKRVATLLRPLRSLQSQSHSQSQRSGTSFKSAKTGIKLCWAQPKRNCCAKLTFKAKFALNHMSFVRSFVRALRLQTCLRAFLCVVHSVAAMLHNGSDTRLLMLATSDERELRLSRCRSLGQTWTWSQHRNRQIKSSGLSQHWTRLIYVQVCRC